VYSLVEFLDQNGFRFNNIKMVMGTAEKIYDYYHQSSQSVFGKKIISAYGSAETGSIAYECPSGSMHIVMENVIVEEINNKIIVTNLFSHSTPVIRYELGDYVVLDYETQCPCGRKHPIIKEITGRIGKKIRGKINSYPSLTLYYIFKNIALHHNLKLVYFGKQWHPGELFLEIIGAESNQLDNIDRYIQEETKKYFKDDIVTEIKFIENIVRNKKKVKDFESYIDE